MHRCPKNKANVLRVIIENTGFMKEGQRNGEKQERKLSKKYLSKFINADIHASLEKIECPPKVQQNE